MVTQIILNSPKQRKIHLNSMTPNSLGFKEHNISNTIRKIHQQWTLTKLKQYIYEESFFSFFVTRLRVLLFKEYLVTSVTGEQIKIIPLV